MRRFISLIVSLIIVFVSVGDGVVAYANATKNNGLYSFAESLTEMIREYDADYGDTQSERANVFYGSATSEKDDLNGFTVESFSSSRLIVKASRLSTFFGALDVVSGYNNLYVLQYDCPQSAINAYLYYLDSDNVEYVEPDFEFTTAEEFSDLIEELPTNDLINDDIPGIFDEAAAEAVAWLSGKVGFGEIKEKLSERIEDDYVLVAVVDSGADLDHELLADRIVDGNVNLSSSGQENSSEDDYGHGTHVAGIVANNTLGNVKIKPYKVLNDYGKGSLSTIALGVEMATADGADVINLSLSGEGESQRLTEAINNAVANDINVVVAAGNASKDLDVHKVSPACVESAITVSATDQYDNLADFSNYDGPIDIAAPGVKIESSYLDNKYISMSGTSMSAPQVSAGIALVQTAFEDKPATECEELIEKLAKKLHENDGENHFGAGLLFLKYILEEEQPKTPNVIFSDEGGDFKKTFNLTLSCEDEDAKIYYFAISPDDLDLELLSKLFDIEKIEDIEEFVEYKSPIKITTDTYVIAVARSEGKRLSSYALKKYTRVADSDQDFYDINSSGFITGYYGKDTDIVIPDKVNGKTVKGIALSAFRDNTKLTSVVLPDCATEIKGYAFAGCTALTSITGKNVTKLGTRVFQGSTIQSVSLPALTEIPSYTFTNCESLTDINLENVTFIDLNAFENTKSLGSVDAKALTEVNSYAFSGSGITSLNAPVLVDLQALAFVRCESLESISVPSVTNIKVGAFRDCISLKSADVSSVRTISANAFENTGFETFTGEAVQVLGTNAFSGSQNLTSVSFPSLIDLHVGGLSGCPNLRYASMPVLTELVQNSFKDCDKFEYLHLPSVTVVDNGAFDGSKIKYLLFDKVETIDSLPHSLLGILLPTSARKISFVPETDFTVYGYRNTFAEEYANTNNKEFSPIPAIIEMSGNMVKVDEQYISVYAVGFNCQYQWYRNTTVSNEGGTIIEGATNSYYEPSPDDNCAAYYCVVYCSDGVNESTFVSEPVENAYEYRDADFTAYNSIRNQYKNIDRELYDSEKLSEIDRLFNIDITDYSMARQNELDELVSRISRLISDARIEYIICDIDGDGKITIIDARISLKAVLGSISLTKVQKLATDADGDGAISIVDSRKILKAVLAQ